MTAGAGPGPGGLGVVLVDDHAVVRRSLAAYLAEQDGLHVLAEAADGQEALDVLEDLAGAGALPALVMMDLGMPRMDGVTATLEIRRRYPSVAVLALSGLGDERLHHEALQAGAAGHLTKGAGPDQISAAILEVLSRPDGVGGSPDGVGGSRDGVGRSPDGHLLATGPACGPSPATADLST